MTTTKPCHNTGCRKTAKHGSKFCSIDCRSANVRNQRRTRRRKTTMHSAIEAERIRPVETGRYWCAECELELTKDQLSEHSDLSRATRLVTLSQPVEDGACWSGELGVQGHALAVDLDGGRACGA